jgi:hypothetical protein
MPTTQEALEQERGAFETRKAQVDVVENQADRLKELEKDVAAWKEKYRRRMKTLRGTIEVPDFNAEFLGTLNLAHDDLFQAQEFLQYFCSQVIKLKTELNQNTEAETQLIRDTSGNFNRQLENYEELRQEILGVLRQRRREMENAALRQRREAEEADYRKRRIDDEEALARHLQAQAQVQVERPNREERNKSNPIGKVKKVDLPKFDGKLKDYFKWKSSFDVLVKNNEELDKSSKFLYLEQSLTGEAHKIMEHLDHSEVSYDTAIQLLEKKYGGKERQLQNMYNNIKAISIAKDFRSMQEFQYALLGISSMMTSQGISKDDCMLHLQLCEKLSQKYMEDYLQYLERNGKDRKLESLIAFVEKVLETKQIAFEATSKQSFKEDTRSQQQKRTINNVRKSNGKQKTCASCEGEHPIWECEEFKRKPMQERYATVKDKRLCFLCLGRGHVKPDCKYKGKCSHCHKDHNTLLHLSQGKEVKLEQRSTSGSLKMPPSTMETKDTTSSNTGLGTEPSSTDAGERKVHNVTQEVEGKVALNMIPIYVYRNNGKKKLRVVALMDSGSDTTFMTEGLKRKLGLHGRREAHTYVLPIQNTKIRRGHGKCEDSIC